MPQSEKRTEQRGGRRQDGPSASKAARFSDLLNEPSSRKTPLGTDTAWALKLKAAVDSAARELAVEIHSAKPIKVCDAGDNDMVFELDTECGRVQATRLRSGEHSFKWLD